MGHLVAAADQVTSLQRLNKHRRRGGRGVRHTCLRGSAAAEPLYVPNWRHSPEEGRQAWTVLLAGLAKYETEVVQGGSSV